MATPSEVQTTKKCHSCEVVKSSLEFLRFSIGPRGGRLACDCIKCSQRTPYPPKVCAACNQLRPDSEYDKTAHAGLICKVCLLSEPDRYLKQCSKCTAVKTISDFPMQGRTGYRLAICSSCDNRISPSAPSSRTDEGAGVRSLWRPKVRVLWRIRISFSNPRPHQ